MKKSLQKPATLEENARVVIIGGGPAGSFLAIHLLDRAKAADRPIRVTIVERCIPESDGLFSSPSQGYRGCNGCAGVISPLLYREMRAQGIRLPPEVVAQEYSHLWIHGRWKNFPLKVPHGQRFLSAFRGTMPPDRQGVPAGLDDFLLQAAQKKGAKIISGTVTDIGYSPSRTPWLTFENRDVERQDVNADFMAICCGVNSAPEKTDKKRNLSSLFNAFQRLNPSFIPPAVRPTLVMEMKPGRPYLKQHMNRELHLIVSGSKQLRLEHTALVPKGEYLTAALVGESIDKANFPGDTQKIIRAFFDLPQIKAVLPHLTADTAPIVCTCTPSMVVRPAVSPAGHRITFVGDALGARLYRDGLYSAFSTARVLARTVMEKGVDQNTLSRTGDGAARWMTVDNAYCRRFFNTLQKALSSELFSRIVYQAFATEMKFKKMEEWPLGKVLWEAGSGSADYRTIVRSLTGAPVLRSLVTGTLKTIRNRATELFFGLRWGEYGRYPAVIVKEQRRAIKESIQAPLEIQLNGTPEMERMYAVKIRASAETIFRLLGTFGSRKARFLKLRFVDVRHRSGKANQTGSIITYHLRHTPVSMDIRLVRTLKNRSLLYEPEELFTTRGVLLFDITPTRDGNNRLVIYTAFDYKRGSSPVARLFFKMFRRFFPDYAHDVVWNHAICTIKAAAEKADQSIMKML